MVDALPVDGLSLNTLSVDASRLMPTTNVNTMRQCTPPPSSFTSIFLRLLHDGMHTIKCTRWNAHDGMHMIESARWNPHNRIRTKESARWNPHLHDRMPSMECVRMKRWNAHEGTHTIKSVRICTMESAQ